MNEDGIGPIVVGVHQDESAEVLRHAARFARLLSTSLICAQVDYDTAIAGPAAGIGAYGLGTQLPIEAQGQPSPEADNALRDLVEAALSDTGTEWTSTRTTGEPTEVLGRLAEQVDAPMIIVGTRESGAGHALHEFFAGSIAVRLAHGQRRPVLVIPLNPASRAQDLPWADTASDTTQK